MLWFTRPSVYFEPFVVLHETTPYEIPSACGTTVATNYKQTNKKQDPKSAPPHLQDHWAARPTQQRALLKRLFQWKAESGGREIVLLAGAGKAEGCSAAETTLELKLPPLLAGSETEGPSPAASMSHINGGPGESGKGEGATKSRKPKRHILRIGQVRVWASPHRIPKVSVGGLALTRQGVFELIILVLARRVP